MTHLRLLTLTLFFTFTPAALAATPKYDCRNFKRFKPVDTIRADVSVFHLNKYLPGLGNLPVDDANQVICKSEVPVKVLVKDIRGREEDWYYCDKPSPENFLVCDTEYQAKPAKIAAKPAMVIRSGPAHDTLDTHMHMNVIPENDESRILDNFTQSLGNDLMQREVILNGSAGGRGSNSDQDYYYVRVHLHK